MTKYYIWYYRLTFGGKEINLDRVEVEASDWRIDPILDTLALFNHGPDSPITVFKWSWVLYFGTVREAKDGS